MPEFLARTAPKPGFARRRGLLQTLRIHICQRQNFFRAEILHNGGDQALFVKPELVDLDTEHLLDFFCQPLIQ